MRDRFDVALANDTDADRHGIVTRSNGLMNPNHYLAAAISYLCTNRPAWSSGCAVGKTAVSSSMIDRVTAKHRRKLFEVPVGFKWFVDNLLDGFCGFAGEESAGASFLRPDGSVSTTDKDGIILGLLAAEITARTKQDPGEAYDCLTRELGVSFYEGIDAPATPERKKRLKPLSPDAVRMTELAGEANRAKLANTLGNGAPLVGIKVIAENEWFAARPSGTEYVYKIYAESFRSEDHLRHILQEAKDAVAHVFGKTEPA